MKNKKQFHTLRTAMYAKGVRQIDLAEEMSKHPNHINALMQGRAIWRLDEMKTVLKMIDETDLNKYFSGIA